MKPFHLLYCSFLLLSSSCNKFLDEKPDIKMAVPKTLADCELLLNDYTTMNMSYPISGEIGVDDYYLDTDTWASLPKIEQRNAYIWVDDPYDDAVQWQKPYKTVYLSNQILEILADLKVEKGSMAHRKAIGAAYFFRAFAFHQLAEVFAPAYTQATASTTYGIPLRLKAGIDEASVRADLQQTYDRIIADYNAAIQYLPVSEQLIGRPHKAAAYAGMARVYLGMGRFAEAYAYADSCLTLKSQLMDFNHLSTFDELPIPQYNVEVLFSAIVGNAGPLAMTRALVDPTLYDSYQARDLRKKVFFQMNEYPEGSYAYKGNYDNGYSNLFVGLTTSEIFLIRCEAAVRTGKVDQALDDLNRLLQARWRTGYYVPITERDPEILLDLLLAERRKELLFRGRRWADLKRLNLEPRFAKQLLRKVGGKEYRLEPNDPKYAFRIPETVIRLSNIPQNKR